MGKKQQAFLVAARDGARATAWAKVKARTMMDEAYAAVQAAEMAYRKATAWSVITAAAREVRVAHATWERAMLSFDEARDASCQADYVCRLAWTS